MSIEIKQTELSDVEILLQDIRDIDKLEIKCVEPEMDLHTAVKFSIDNSVDSKTVYVEDELMCIYGLCKMTETSGMPWMLATNKIKQFPYRIAKYGKKIVSDMIKDFEYLYNVVHSQNLDSQRFLKFCGFRILKESTLLGNEQFYYFDMKNNIKKES